MFRVFLGKDVQDFDSSNQHAFDCDQRIFIAGKACPTLTVPNSVGTNNIDGFYQDNHNVQCASGYRIEGEDNSVTSTIATCNSSGLWTGITSCHSQFFLTGSRIQSLFVFFIESGIQSCYV